MFWEHIGDTGFPQCPVINNLSMQIVCRRVAPGLPRSSRSSFAIYREPCQCLTWYFLPIYDVLLQLVWRKCQSFICPPSPSLSLYLSVCLSGCCKAVQLHFVDCYIVALLYSPVRNNTMKCRLMSASGFMTSYFFNVTRIGCQQSCSQEHFQIGLREASRVFTRRWSLAEYWKHFVARFNVVLASGYNSIESILIRMKFGIFRAYCLELALTDFGRDPRRSERERARRIFVFFCQVSSARFYRLSVGQISQTLHTRRASVRWWILSEQNFENFSVRGRFLKTQILGQNLQGLATSGPITPYRYRSTKTNDQMIPVRNVPFPFLPLESTQSFP